VPEAAVHKHSNPSGTKDHIRPPADPGEWIAVDAKSETKPMKGGTKSQFSWCVALSRALHAKADMVGGSRRPACASPTPAS